ncbi:ABC transporter substrate-binding protein [Actinacidiphila guanduensis]|uniref:Peptide/nickel transport system substrate-binding protein n=1 Tax=Actinacidiphila guanduensis TaxID=310781 RepID=A0A1H0LE36_9ACTN|nr:ABC transporter substrate-binding protein [Actinacidiphila guanduensis]SDO66477.1 peptide/nickel transport system substrate-binding protein [Actinacidiphila guanduensis]
MNRKLLVLPALLGALTPVVAGCGSSGGSGGSGKPIVVGTTDSIELNKSNPAPLDPATSYDSATWNVFYNTFQMLLTYPRGSTTPTPDAAKECHFTDATGLVYSCTMRSGLKFSNGHDLTAQDVKFSIERTQKINSPTGPVSLIADVKSVETPDASHVVFHLKSPDATFPAKLATPAAAIVDHQVYPADKPYTGWRLTGSGPYTMDSWAAGKEADFSKNSKYQGILKLHNDAVKLMLYTDSHKMEAALKDHTLDVMTRTLAPDQIEELQDSDSSDIKLTEAPGGEARYLFLNTDDGDLKSLAVRKAMAEIIDRQAITRDIYKRTAVPLYSVVPQGINSHINSFFDVYKEPNVAEAKKTLKDAGITEKVPLTINFRRDTGGTENQAEAQAIEKQLDSTGLFDVHVQAEQWNAFVAAAAQRKYQIFAINWLPDFPDPDNYIAPFFGKDGFLNLPYQNKQIQDQILPDTRRQAARSSTTDAFGQAQNIIADDVPMIPLWQANQYIAAHSNITGVEWALNASTTTQFWELGRGASG